MSKQSPSRNLRSKGFKVKHAVQIFTLLVICTWLLYQLKHSHDKKAYEERSAKISGNMQNGHEIITLGRRGFHPRVDETSLDNGRHREKEEESGDVDESKAEESEEEGKGAGDDEVDVHDLDRAEEESEGVEDLIDEEDTEREEESEEQDSEDKGSDLEDLSLVEDQAGNEDTRDAQEAREEQYKGDDASSAVKQNTQTIRNEIEIGSLRKVKEEEVDNADMIEAEEENKTNGKLDFTVDINDSDPTIRDGGTAKSAAYGEERGEENSTYLDVQTNDNSSVKAVEEPKVSNDSSVMMVEITDSLDGTEVLPKLSLASSRRHLYLEAFSGKQNENTKSKDMQSDSSMMLSATDNLDATKEEMKVSTASETESVVSEAIANHERSSAHTSSNDNDNEVVNGKFHDIDNQ